MKDIALYYPSIQIPDSSWLRNSILYSDNISTILPFEDLESRNLSDETKLLIDEGIFTPKYVFYELDGNDPKVREFTSKIEAIIDSEEYKQIIPNFEEIPKEERWKFHDYSLYTVKLSYGLEGILRERGLLKYSAQEGVINLERNTAIFYMTQLANFLASKDANNRVTPSTNNEEYEKKSFRINLKETKTMKLSLESCLPAPNINVPLNKVVAFKRKREEELRNFKNILYEVEKKLVKVDSVEEQKIELLQFSNNLKKGVDDIKKLLGDSKIDLVLNSFSSLLDIKQPEIIGSLSSAGVGGAAAIAACPLVGLGAAAVILIGTTVSSAFRIKREVDNSAYSYVYHAKKKGIIK